ncbi:alkaline phosphatase D family protein [Algiphilus sp.]|uniref:alkaline phosphatase D family protein n=1 Tax=Algiphilus sp. TaxID=1872431 RepID=UPI003C5DCC60
MAPPLTRRHFVHAVGALAAAPLLPGCDDSAAPGEQPGTPQARPETAAFAHGVASGDPLPDAVILWTRVTVPEATAPFAVRWTVAHDEGLVDVVAEGEAATAAGRDYTMKVDAGGLAPDRFYWYGFTVETASGRVHSPVGRTRTAPAADADPDALRFAVVTCADYTRGLYNAYARVAELDDIAAVIHLGDYIYENDRKNAVRRHEPPAELVALSEYRRRYACYRETAELQAVHARHPMIWVWDDHETCDGTWREGADPSNHDDAEHGPFADRKAAALQAALEWMPIRSPDPAVPERIYRSFRFGNLADLAMLDTRRIGRDRQGEPNAGPLFTQSGDFADPERHILGAEQEAWLSDHFANGSSAWRLIGNQVVFAPLLAVGTPDALGLSLYANPDQWDGYAPARERVLAMMEGLDNVVFLTGDVHASMAFDIAADPANPLVYDGLSGRGSHGVEFVTPSISSGGEAEARPDDLEEWLEQLLLRGAGVLRLTNPHLKLFEATRCGYITLDVRREALRAEYWLIPTVMEETTEQTLRFAFDVAAGVPRAVEDLSVRLGGG